MQPELRDRRERTWEMLVQMGLPYGEAVTRLANQYGVAESTIKSDINRMESWVGELDINYYQGVSRLRELRQNRQRYNQMALQAQRDDNLSEERKVRKRIDDSVVKDIKLSQRLGLTNEEPTALELQSDLSDDEKSMLDAVCGTEPSDEVLGIATADADAGAELEGDPDG